MPTILRFLRTWPVVGSFMAAVVRQTHLESFADHVGVVPVTSQVGIGECEDSVDDEDTANVFLQVLLHLLD